MSFERLSLPKGISAEKLQYMEELFPEAFADGRLNIQVVMEELGLSGDFDQNEEHYGLKWPDKNEAKRLTVKQQDGTLSPVIGEGFNEYDTHNIVIEGDNLEVLRILQKAYSRRVKLIYIDPPYNTGDDFIYKDNFVESVTDYLLRTGQSDEVGLLTSNLKSNGRFHSNWLNMIYPRLVIGRRLLRHDGFIVVSIDDNELANLKLIMSSIFGEENYIATIVWDKNRKNDAKFFSVGHEYMLVYARDKRYLKENNVILRAPKEGIEEIREKFEEWRKNYNDDWKAIQKEYRNYFKKLPKDDPRKPLGRFNKLDEKGPYRDDGNINWPGGGGPTYDVLHPITGLPCKKPRSGWRYPTLERMQEEISKGNIVFGQDESTVPSIRTNLFEKSHQVLKSVHYSYAQTASDKFDEIFDGVRVFDNPKHYEDLRLLVEYLTDKDDLIVDFFSGSGSIAHAVMEANKREESYRKYLCIQLPEPVNSAKNTGKNALSLGLKTVSDIGRERIKRVANSMKQDGSFGDLGFRFYKLTKSNFKNWRKYDGDSVSELQNLFSQFNDKLIDGWEIDDVLTEILLIEGYPLDSKIVTFEEFKNNTVFIVSHPEILHGLIVCLDDKLSFELVSRLINHRNTNDVFVCLEKAVTDDLKIRMSDTVKIKFI